MLKDAKYKVRTHHSVCEDTKWFFRLTLLLPIIKQRLQNLFKVLKLHLVHETSSYRCLIRGSSQPNLYQKGGKSEQDKRFLLTVSGLSHWSTNLIAIWAIPNQSKLSHVWSSTTIRAASYPYNYRLAVLQTNLNCRVRIKVPWLVIYIKSILSFMSVLDFHLQQYLFKNTTNPFKNVWYPTFSFGNSQWT